VKKDQSLNQRFSSRWGLLFSALGIAVGTENIWRFPRIAAQNGVKEDKNDWQTKGMWSLLIKYFIPMAAAALLVWWLYLSVTEFAPDSWYNPFDPFSSMSCVVQWAVAAFVLYLVNRRLILLNKL